MTSIRIRTQTHEDLKRLAKEQGSKLTELLEEIASLLVEVQLSPRQMQARLKATTRLEDFKKLLTDQSAKMLKAVGQQERNYLFPLSQELKRLQERTGHLASGQMDIAERLNHLEQLIQEMSQTLDKQYELLIEV
ncbi:MAG: hypothetical protein ACYC2U_03320 [Candidatus Amoebophilus sp.]